MNPKTKKGFTLVELLIVIAVLAILIAAVIIVLNPGEILAQARDSQRLSDISTLTSVMQLYIVQPPVGGIDLGSCPTGGRCTFDPGTGNGPFIGDCNSASGTVRTVDGKGWMDVNFTAMSTGSPVPTLPTDPTNNATYFYGYFCNKSANTFEFANRLESAKYRDKMKTDAGANSTCTTYTGTDCFYEVGSALIPPAQATPTFSPSGGEVALGTPVTIISSGADAIYYTTNGIDPTTSSTNQAITPLVINSAGTVKALAVKTGYSNSAIGSASYTLSAPIALNIGDIYGGGKVAYILALGDPGYDAGTQHGLIAATSDQSTSEWWGCGGTLLGANGTNIGSGNSNTATIMSGCAPRPIAASDAQTYTGGGHSDWYLPSKDELNKLYLNKTAIGGFSTGPYWSSSENNAWSVWYQVFNNGYQDTDSRGSSNYVRAVRSF